MDAAAAKGTSHAGGDVDLLIVGTVPLARALAALESLERRIGRQTSVRLFSAGELRRRIQKIEPFVRGILDGPMIALVGMLDDAR